MKELLVFAEPRGKDISSKLSNPLLLAALAYTAIMNVINRVILVSYQTDQQNNFYVTYTQDETRDLYISAYVDGAILISFFGLLWVMYSYAYPKSQDSGGLIRQDIFHALQLSIFRDILFSFYYVFWWLDDSRNSYYQIRDVWNALYVIFVIITIIYFAYPITQRLNETFDSLNNAILGAIIISAVIYGISFGLNWIIGIFIKLPLGVST